MAVHHMSLAGFIAHIEKAASEMHRHEHEAMKKAAKLVEHEAKGALGRYQDAVGPFAAWEELADRTKNERVQLGFTENDPGLRDGTMRDSIGHVVGHREAVIGSNDENLVWFELGTDKQPPRSVLGAALARKAEEVAVIIKEEVAMGIGSPGFAPRGRAR
jgi:hypothetical protein